MFIASGALYNILALDWCLKKDLKFENSETFGLWLADRLDFPIVGKVHHFVDLVPMNIALILYLLNTNVPCILGIPFF